MQTNPHHHKVSQSGFPVLPSNSFTKKPRGLPTKVASRPSYWNALKERVGFAAFAVSGPYQIESIADGANDHPAGGFFVSAPRRNKTMARSQPPLAVPAAHVDRFARAYDADETLTEGTKRFIGRCSSSAACPAPRSRSGPTA
jgi:hypothetical protein